MIRFFIFFLLSISIIEAKTEPLERLGVYGDALNIEGGLIAKRDLKKGQIWANVCFVLDRPMLENADLDEITKKNPYRLKEASIESYNECEAALVQALILKYYLTRPGSSYIVVNVHRNSSGPSHLDDLEKILERCFTDLDIKKIEDRKFGLGSNTLELKYGVKNLSGYDQADVIISISLVAGFHPKWPSGTPIIPVKFTPFDVHSMIVASSGAYEVLNHLNVAIKEILALQTGELIKTINREFKSPNPAKAALKATRITKNDLKKGNLLQVSGMFYPKQLPSTFEVY